MRDKVCQEFYCREEGGGCGGYVLVRLNTGITGTIEFVCPKCGHKHQRQIKSGEIVGEKRYDGKPTEDMKPPLAAWSKKPRTKKMKEHRDSMDNCDSVVARRAKDFLQERMFELWGGV